MIGDGALGEERERQRERERDRERERERVPSQLITSFAVAVLRSGGVHHCTVWLSLCELLLDDRV